MQEGFDASLVWEIATKRIRTKSEICYQQWFQPLTPLRIDNEKNSLVIGVPDEFFGEWISDNLSDLLNSVLTDIEGVNYGYSMEAGHVRELEVEDSETIDGDSEVESELVEPPRVDVGSGRVALLGHTFDTFVVSEENRYACYAIKAAVESPGLYNPLYIYGGSGVGKTHLMLAAAQDQVVAEQKLRVRYASCGELLDDFYNLLQNKRSLSEFRASVRNVDILLVDDVHVLAGKPQMQEEFFKLFNNLFLQKKQIILTSDKQPCEIEGLETRLVTRFESGLTTEIGVPEVEGRLAILRMMREDTLIKYKLEDVVLEFLAQHISSSVRRLKGAFMRLASLASAKRSKSITVPEVEILLAAQLAQECSAKTVTLESIQQAVAEQFGLKVADILGSKRPKNIAEPRLIAMYLSRRLTSYSLPEIGKAFGKTHATILNAVNKVPEICAKDDAMRRTVQQLEHQLKKM